MARRAANRLMDIMAARPDPEKPNQNLTGIFNYCDPADDELFIPIIMHPVYLELSRRILGDGFQCISAGGGCNWWKPGAPAQGLHVDAPYGWFLKNGFPVPDVNLLVNSLWMLTDFTRENGGTRVIPFSHHARRSPRKSVTYEHQVAAEGPAGSIVIFNGKLWHGAGANTTTDSQRVGLSVAYAHGLLDTSATGANWPQIRRSVRDRLPAEYQPLFHSIVED